jgi:hypothetical protein
VLFLFFSIEIDELRPEELEKALLHLDLPQHEIIASLLLFSGRGNSNFNRDSTIYLIITNCFGFLIFFLLHPRLLPPNKITTQSL